MSAELSAEQCKQILASNNTVRPLLLPGFVNCSGLASCCAVKSKTHAGVGFKGGSYLISGETTAVPQFTFSGGLLIPDKELNYLIEWEDV
jgi:hypothetical protein